MAHGEANLDKQTFIEEGTKFKGTLTSTCPVAVRGELDGEIRAPTLTITDTGTVVGDVEAKSIRSEGVLAGEVDADDIFLSGQVRDNTVIRAKSLEVKLAQDQGKLEVTFGQCTLEVGAHPSQAETGDGLMGEAREEHPSLEPSEQESSEASEDAGEEDAEAA